MKDLYPEYLETLPSLEGKAVAITGTTSGTGYWAAVGALRKGADKLFLLNRASIRSENSVKTLQEEKEKIGSSTQLFPVECDLSSFESVRNGAKAVITQTPDGLDVLVNNAGIFIVPDRRTQDGFDRTSQVNHLSHFLLTHLLLPSLAVAAKKRGDVRIVQHTSEARKYAAQIEEKFFIQSEPGTLGGDKFFACFTRYQQTKVANTTFAMALHKRIEKTDLKGLVKSVVADPGNSDTPIYETLKVTHRNEGTYGWTIKMFSFAMAFATKVGYFKSQSAADGSMPLMEAAFGAKVDGGDLLVPEKGLVGLPLKAISKASEVLKGDEGKAMSEEKQNLIWDLSEKALGISFFSSLDADE
eukprot:snap_masked-scaffold_14-processed-gene-4.38-mRNA-1 protein AED:0.01 eAED:0.02 QI:0/-1/0/1/-1/1/1/0/356